MPPNKALVHDGRCAPAAEAPGVGRTLRYALVIMKKAIISRAELDRALHGVAEELQCVAGFDLAHKDARELFQAETLNEEFFSTRETTAAPSSGRGRRVTLPVGWIWPPASMSAEEGAVLIRSQITAIPGVEMVAPATLDPQFGFIWSILVTIRLDQ